MKKLGEKLQILRKQQGLTQTELSNMLSVDQSYIVKMEKSQRLPSLEVLFKLTQIFNVSGDVFMNDDLDLIE